MSDFLMPSLGADMEAATLIQWLVKPGDAVKKGDVIVVVETNKGAIEVEVFTDGVIEQLYVKESENVPVGTPLARIRTDEIAPSVIVPAPAQIETTPAQIIAAPIASTTRIYASPAARCMAAGQGLDVATYHGSGPAGAVLLRDISATPKDAVSPFSAGAKAPVTMPQTIDVKLPDSETAKPKKGYDVAAMRKAIAAAMAKSKREIPHYYLACKIDMSNAQHWLEHYNSERPPEQRLLMSVLMLKAVALALRRFPEMNGFYRDDQYYPSTAIHPGFAINLRSGGLMTPALHDADKLTLPELMQRLQDLIERARHGLLRSSEMMDATITMTALGERGVEQVFGVIYPPQVAIVGFGKITPNPWVVNDAIGIRPIMNATLAGDHRVSDGHRGALFLAELDHLLQIPEQL